MYLNSIMIHSVHHIKVNNDWETNHIKSLYLNLSLIVGDFDGGWV